MENGLPGFPSPHKARLGSGEGDGAQPRLDHVPPMRQRAAGLATLEVMPEQFGVLRAKRLALQNPFLIRPMRRHVGSPPPPSECGPDSGPPPGCALGAIGSSRTRPRIVQT